jgi:TonB family protein
MGNLISKTPKPISRGRLFAEDSSGMRQDADIYNRSSLALDPSDEPLPERHPLPRLVSWPNAAMADVPTFMGLDQALAHRDRKSSAVSFIVHAVIISAMLWLTIATHAPFIPATVVTPVNITLYAPPPPPPKVMPLAPKMGGGGGGGAHQVIEPTRGRPPEVAKMTITPPQIIRIDRPKLGVEPTMQVKIPDNTNLSNLGMSQSPQIALASQGSGSGSGFGSGIGGGIGMGHGSGAGPGSGGGYGGGIMSVGGGVSAPVVVHSVQPEFTQDARSANFQGGVSIQLIVDAQGNPQNIRVLRHLGMGLDEKAIEAVRQYKFKPALYQGHPVAVQMVIEVEFHLY